MAEFHVLKTIQFTFCVVSDFSYIDNVSYLYLMGKLHYYLPTFGVKVIRQNISVFISIINIESRIPSILCSFTYLPTYSF